jgi:hypothetical protein
MSLLSSLATDTWISFLLLPVIIVRTSISLDSSALSRASSSILSILAALAVAFAIQELKSSR